MVVALEGGDDLFGDVARGVAVAGVECRLAAAGLRLRHDHFAAASLDQLGGDTTVRAIEDILGVVVTRNEAAWIKELRDASGHTDPSLTSKGRAAIRGVFGK